MMDYNHLRSSPQINLWGSAIRNSGIILPEFHCIQIASNVSHEMVTIASRMQNGLSKMEQKINKKTTSMAASEIKLTNVTL